MGLLSLLGNMAKVRSEAAAAPQQAHTAMPLGLVQGSAVRFAPTVTVSSGVPGSRFPALADNLTVTGVGRMQLFGLDVYRAYLSDGASFIQMVMDGAGEDSAQRCGVQEAVLYTNINSSFPDAEGLEYLLNDRDGYIGLFQFNLGGENGASYAREWQPAGGDWVPPVQVSERRVDQAGVHSRASHRLMAYSRRLEAAGWSSVERLLPVLTVVEDGGESLASFDVFVGVDLDASALTVFTAT